MDYQTYRTRNHAEKEVARMKGWLAKPVQLYLPDDPNASRAGNAWVIQCDDTLYLRSDGYVR